MESTVLRCQGRVLRGALWLERAHQTCRSPEQEAVGWEYLSCRHDRAGTDHAALADVAAVEESGLNANQASIVDATAVQHRSVTHHDICSHQRRVEIAQVDHRPILKVGSRTHTDVVHISPQYASKPDTRVVFQCDVADEKRTRCHEAVIGDGRNVVSVAQEVSACEAATESLELRLKLVELFRAIGRARNGICDCPRSHLQGLRGEV